ncbi:hypothetical protein [Methylovirgula sp. 4M-Z18]|uniref:hypothetical protein n=1 Tax=Methylovirgula sp. 4M-Z18 TaxID=2293567 RepID=UPI000E2F66ED|nr:hypothetical protein [Methylovirgula sp. 4M-Z18]RFB76330.1 hypothetical protein DYH55_21100 [Methylovirgula sp. 4M-Z18]
MGTQLHFIGMTCLSAGLAVMTGGTSPARAQVLGLTCGTEYTDNRPNRCNWQADGKVVSGVSSCRLTDDPTVAIYTNCRGEEEKVKIIGGLTACCTSYSGCTPRKPEPQYVAACAAGTNRIMRAPGAVRIIEEGGSGLPFGIGIGIGGHRWFRRRPDENRGE